MKAGITITATLTGNMRGTYQLLAELEAIKRRVQKLSGKHIMYVHNVSGDISPATRSMIVSEQMVQNAVTPAMYLKPAAFSPKIASGRALPDKARAIAESLRAQMQKQVMKTNRKVVLNRAQFMEIYFNDFQAYPNTRMGNLLNSATQHALK
jgi:hypothetical protein